MLNTSDLKIIESETWSFLQEAAERSADAFRYITFATVDEVNQPQVRILVLRGVDTLQRVLEFYTDTRSPKWHELTENPSVAALGYDPNRRIQLRLDGKVDLLGPGTPLHIEAWRQLSVWGRNTYSGGKPGELMEEARSWSMEGGSPSLEHVKKDERNFGVIRFHVRRLDWLILMQPTNRRAIFFYDVVDRPFGMSWVNP